MTTGAATPRCSGRREGPNHDARSDAPRSGSRRRSHRPPRRAAARSRVRSQSRHNPDDPNGERRCRAELTRGAIRDQQPVSQHRRGEQGPTGPAPAPPVPAPRRPTAPLRSPRPPASRRRERSTPDRRRQRGHPVLDEHGVRSNILDQHAHQGLLVLSIKGRVEAPVTATPQPLVEPPKATARNCVGSGPCHRPQPK